MLIMVEKADGDYYRLVEGHKRLGCLWALVDPGSVSINSTHTVLIVLRVFPTGTWGTSRIAVVRFSASGESR